MIQIHHQNGYYRLGALAAADGFVQQGQKSPAIEYAGQWIHFGQVAQLAGDEFVGQNEGPKPQQHHRHDGLQHHKLRHPFHQIDIHLPNDRCGRRQLEQHRPQQQERAVQPGHRGKQIPRRHTAHAALGQSVRCQQKADA
ncbi:hypothetical protein D3C72_1848780 [compost metagenome]